MAAERDVPHFEEGACERDGQEGGRFTGRVVRALRDRREILYLVALTGVAFILRLLALKYWMDLPGDGPTRAMYAYTWYRSPHIVLDGIWLPGFMYLTGLFSFILHDPLISTRVFNVALGTATLPLVYLLVRRVYGRVPATLSAFVLAFLPLHVSLSASSLTEATFLFEIVGAMFFLVLSVEEQSHRALYLSIFVILASLAVMTRYEAWLLIPFFALYLYWMTRKTARTLLVVLILALFPLIWSAGNYIHTGNALLGFTAAEDVTWSKPVGLLHAAEFLGRFSVEQLEWTLFILAIWGLVEELFHLVRGRTGGARLLWFMITCAYWVIMLRLAMTRGATFQARYLLFPIVMAVPFLGLPVASRLGTNPRLSAGLLVFLALAFLAPHVAHYPRAIRDLTTERPDSVRAVASWLKKNHDGRRSVLMTSIDGQSTYLPLYFPGIGPHDYGHFIYYHHVGMSDSRLRDYLVSREPDVLVTCDEDSELVSKIERVWGRKVISGSPLFEKGSVKVYQIKRSTSGKDRSIEGN